MNLVVVKVPNRTIPDHGRLGSPRNRRRYSEPAIPTQRLHLLQYHYSPLRERQIRLLKCLGYNPENRVILATLITVDLDNQPSFTALSYTWGSPLCSPAGESIEFPGDALPSCRLVLLDSAVSIKILLDMKWSFDTWIGNCIGEIRLQKNLSDFLLCLNDETVRWKGLPPRDTLLWIDAISIDQSNAEEKADQIPLMGDIYSNAQEVIGWLGMGISDVHNMLWMIKNVAPALVQHVAASSQENTINLLAGIENLRGHIPYKNDCWTEHLKLPSPPGGDCFALWKSYYSFFAKRTWFRRAWILQEVLLASKMNLILPGSSISREDIIWFEEVLGHTGWRGRLTSFEDVPSSSHWKDICMLRALINAARDKTLYRPENDLTIRIEVCLAALLDSSGSVVKRIVETIQIPLGFLNPGSLTAYLLERNRIYGATFDVDKINTILGVASKILVAPDARKPYLTINPSASVERVYIEISKLIIKESGHLSLLFNVESQAFRKRKVLPSWVPDFSVQIYKSSQHFNVWRNDLHLPQPGRMPMFIGDCMVPFATEIGKVQEIFDGPWTSLEYANVNIALLILAAASKIDPVYRFTGEHRLEALLRLMLDNPSNAKFPRPPELQDKALPCLLGLLAHIAPYLPLQWGNVGNVQTATMEQMTSVFPDWERYERSPNEMQLIQEMFYIRNFCIFITDTGYIGKAEKGIERSDSVAIFERGDVPFIVRKHPAGEQPPLSQFIRFLSRLWPKAWHSFIFHRLSSLVCSILPSGWRLACAENYTFLGQCYVHGVMCGELITPTFRKKFVPICLV
ncbi:hypothetical protein NA56DRAFT_642133 [Hyaloscypha hepaticicola]|uniref:Heterokaryon incompatibility domain-containing protein n=1 Tax=Hyaloscypha hepaticicola TaxID=2082293 RepID=A0A2J6QHY1_9HELO|nr:hypothetical protein NA56DRAFT_642133 [Hyaloscypha hepaticicola]